MRYVGSMHGYQPSDALIAAKSDSIADAYNDFYVCIFEPVFGPPELKQANIDMVFEKLNQFLEYMEPFAEKAKGKWITGSSKLTVADFWIGSLFVNYIFNKNVAYARDRWEKVFEYNYPNLKAYGERFAAENEKYLKERPQLPI